MARPLVIILNGVGSAGKRSTAKAIQRLAPRPMLHLAMDAFLEMMPAHLFGHADGYIFEQVGTAAQPQVAVLGGPVMDRLMSGMRHAVAAMAAEGNSLVVDDVMFLAQDAATYQTLLRPHADVVLVGLFAPLAVLEAREKNRGDRALGLARWQFDRVHQGMTYDLEVDTSTKTPDEVAQAILAVCPS